MLNGIPSLESNEDITYKQSILANVVDGQHTQNVYLVYVSHIDL